ncbi:MAG: hypothetical protein ACRCYU_12415 [Nocardioides sp.]
MNLDSVVTDRRDGDDVWLVAGDQGMRRVSVSSESERVVLDAHHRMDGTFSLSPDLARKMGTALLAAARVAERAQR